MTIYDLTQAMLRHRRFLIIGFSVLILGVLVATFTIEDGSPAWRAQEKYQASIQIAVITPEATDLTTTDVRDDRLRTAASLFTGLIQTDEAAVAIGAAAGFDMGETIDAELDDRAAVITATVVAPSAEQAVAAAEGVFTWLTDKLQEPLVTAELTDNTTPTTVPLLFLNGPFDSSVGVTFDDTLGSVRSDVFVQFAIDEEDPTTLAVSANAGRTVSNGATLSPTVSLVMRLIGADEEILDTTRIAPPPLPALVESIPALTINLRPGSVTAPPGGTTGTINSRLVDIEWVEDVRTAIGEPETVDNNGIEMAVLTSEIGVATIGGRRGPITAFAVLIVGSLILLSVVIVAESWRRAKIAAVGEEGVESGPEEISSDGGLVSHVMDNGVEPAAGPHEPGSDPTTEERDFAGRP